MDRELSFVWVAGKLLGYIFDYSGVTMADALYQQ